MLNNMPLGLKFPEYIYKHILGEQKKWSLDLEGADKSLFNSINSLTPEV
jgi:hypothetical protein